MLGPDWLGRRVVIRRRTGTTGPAYTDALGELVELTDSRVTVVTRSGPVGFARADVALARLVLPSTADQFALEAVAAQGWRAAETQLSADGWLLRADHGWTGRANSALPLRTARRPLPDVLHEVRDWYARHSLPARIQVPLPAATALDRGLEQRGWTSVEDVAVLTTRLDMLVARTRRPGVPRAAGTTVLRPAPDDAWLAGYHYRGGPLPGNARALLARHDHAAFVSAHGGDGTVVAIVRGALDHDWLGLTALEVEPGWRRRGLATELTAAAAGWALGQGAQRCYLQVSESNVTALALYSALGFHRHHRYRYRLEPT